LEDLFGCEWMILRHDCDEMVISKEGGVMWVILKVKSFVDFTFLRESSVGEGFLKASDS